MRDMADLGKIGMASIETTFFLREVVSGVTANRFSDICLIHLYGIESPGGDATT